MTNHDDNSLDRLLPAEPDDPGCSAGASVLDNYVELVVAGRDAAAAHPRWATHLDACPACRTDYEGLVEAVRLFGDDEA